MLKADKTTFSLILFLTVIGAFVRLYAPLSAIMPINDGGLFYVMIQDIRTNYYSLPLVTTYNQANIPFAYPPLAFYLYALTADVTKIPLLDLMRVLPAIISSLTIPAFYLLAKEILGSKPSVFLAVFGFALLPRTYDWIIMGGGVTRALGFLFALLALRQTYRLFANGSRADIFPVIALSSLVVYSHPEAIVHTIIGSAFFYLWKDRSRRGFAYALVVAIGVCLITAPWWWTVESRHGVSSLVAPLTAVRQDNISMLNRFFSLFQFQFSDEPFLNIFGILGLLGLFFLLANKQYFIPTWLVTAYLIEPRSAPLYIMAPLAMAFGAGLDKFILPGLRGHDLRQVPDTKNDADIWTDQLLEGRAVKIFIGFIFVYGLISNIYLASQSLTRFILTRQDLDAFQWARDDAPANSQFILIAQENPLLDPSSDWFPALTGQKSIATVYGYEWVNDGLFGTRLDQARALQICAVMDISCIKMWQTDTGKEYSHIYIRKIKNGAPVQVPLVKYLEFSSEHEKVYETDSVVVFRKNNP